ncbi:hypothetical protein ARALYDRAFT_899958 [Arabidopsis lyrata subsp. lyrata]|uniref:NYN domain-containing protein n=1 Tax=Arabidopsis lyrata subsp. lyrata TaxID=81972 RepID=D7L7K3_ARALL|nr:uncharacterized protein LOC9322118 [Arabidopsis lyrata subsp. lyrata]EFH60258.1 hypothetical protein ARALYDRAFT_899958 [Arabidopsis lyrata subsp. lyrata]|eukprot:XP_002883999.1 uncharacterized protein LOC9322118 [Arabidopsis lyrata subsp. lyrata]
MLGYNEFSIDTAVFWLTEEIPNSSDPNLSISRNILLALEKLGILSLGVIRVYAPEEPSSKKAEWCDPRIYYYFEGDKDTRVDTMFFDLITFASCSRTNPANVMVISKSPLKDECLRVLRSLEARGSKVFLVQSDDESEFFRSQDSILDCTRLLDGSIPVVFDGDSVPMELDNASATSSTSWETDTDPENE